MKSSEKPLELVIHVARSADASLEEFRAEIEALLPTARFAEFVVDDDVRLLSYHLDERPETDRLEQVHELQWVEWSDGTAWTGPVVQESSGEGCPFAALAEQMSTEELEAFRAEHRRDLSKQT